MIFVDNLTKNDVEKSLILLFENVYKKNDPCYTSVSKTNI
ncbi:hypothetical protein RV00_GL001275 [Enterococcus devriesei]|uniref:Uncharacterized protein n=1 Tax=Enterococcus devriesei TaxID=319970 RepID=A0A1L8SXR0_9ENTE|nr:hypothetical protein RV00_GL001275 [Enterococcus devriesei]